jgi:lantibiotic modifying enzyme
MSTVDYYLETGDDARAGILLAQVIKYAEQNGRYSIGFADFIPNNNVTLFFGLAGIGYELIRYTNKEEFLTAL